jgi:hypothetical protein
LGWGEVIAEALSGVDAERRQGAALGRCPSDDVAREGDDSLASECENCESDVVLQDTRK